MPRMRDLLRVPEGPVDLSSVDPRATPGLPRDRVVHRDPKRWARAEVADLLPHLADLQERLYASAKVNGDPRRLLLVLQAMDCGGKDGTITHVVGGLNPSGVRVTSLGPPTEEERRHHFLWRIERALPAPGYVGVFNRSHYEDVLVVRVHGLVPPEVWGGRYDEINAFEASLVSTGFVLVKLMLHISPEEQGKRLLRRLDDPTKRWKYNSRDTEERARWKEYQEAYSDVLSRCSPEEAPWYVVPADRKWYRDWAVAHLLAEVMEGMDLHYPQPELDLEAERRRVRSTAPT
jgi:PPK2 family polyphosphate:nucleotide phosphotransferase